MKTPYPSLIERVAIRSRAYQDESDYARLRFLLVESYCLVGTHLNWQLDRLEVMRFGRHAQEELSGVRSWPQSIRLWEAQGGKLVGAVLNEGEGDFFLQVHPHYRHIEDDMLAWLEGHHAAARLPDAAVWPVFTYADENDAARYALLARRGYVNLGRSEAHRTRSLDAPIAAPKLPEGYAVRTLALDEPSELARLAETMTLTFGRTTWTAETARVVALAPTYRPDLDFIVAAPDGAVAAFCIVWYDSVNRVGVFEPVGTHPAHRRRGLSSAMMLEAMRRVKALGAKKVHVSTGADYYANALYESLGFSSVDYTTRWQKDLAT